MKQWKELKVKHPDALLLFCVGDFLWDVWTGCQARSGSVGDYIDRETPSRYLHGWFSTSCLGHLSAQAYRAGERVAICDQLEHQSRNKRSKILRNSSVLAVWNDNNDEDKDMSKNQQYAERYAAEAMEQMKRYGIPASVTLAQGILESRNGQSELSQLGNNHFGVKASAVGWRTVATILSIPMTNRMKFCRYATVGDSYEHHSKILKNSSRTPMFQTLSDDYKGMDKRYWARRLCHQWRIYAASLQKIIEINGLQKYDQQVMKEMRAEGKKFGVEQNARNSNGIVFGIDIQ